MVIAVADGGWSAGGRLLNDDPDEREAFDFRCALDLVSLRFEDDKLVSRGRAGPDDTGWFIMTEYTGPGAERTAARRGGGQRFER